MRWFSLSVYAVRRFYQFVLPRDSDFFGFDLDLLSYPSISSGSVEDCPQLDPIMHHDNGTGRGVLVILSQQIKYTRILIVSLELIYGFTCQDSDIQKQRCTFSDS